MGQKGRGREGFRWEYLAQSEEKAASPRWPEQEVWPPLIGVDRGPAGGRTTVEGLLSCAPVTGVALPFERLESFLRQPRLLPVQEGRKKGQELLLLFCGWRELRKENSLPWPLCLLGPSFLGPQAGTELRLF